MKIKRRKNKINSTVYNSDNRTNEYYIVFRIQDLVIDFLEDKICRFYKTK